MCHSSGLAYAINKSSGVTWNYKNIEGICTHFKNKHDETITGNANARDKLQDNEFNFRNDTVKDRIYFKNKELKTLEDWVNFFKNNEVIVEYECEEYVEKYTEQQKTAHKQLQYLMLYENDNYIECLDEIKLTQMELIYYPNTFYNNNLATKHELDKTNNDTIQKMQEINEELSSNINMTAHDVTTTVSSSVTSAILTLLNNRISNSRAG